jgi:hypothetical protein
VSREPLGELSLISTILPFFSEDCKIKLLAYRTQTEGSVTPKVGKTAWFGATPVEPKVDSSAIFVLIILSFPVARKISGADNHSPRVYFINVIHSLNRMAVTD